MTSTHSSSSKAFFVSIFLLSCAIPFFVHVTSSPAKRFPKELNHHNSTPSPLQNPSYTPFSSLRSVDSGNSKPPLYRPFPDGGFLAKVIRKDMVNMMIVFLGSRGIRVVAQIATANYFSWVLGVHCKHCYRKKGVFNNTESSSFQEFSCVSDECSSLPERICDKNKHHEFCHHKLTYGDGSYVISVYSKDRIKLSASGINALNDFPFGCAYETKGSFSQDAIAIIGIARFPISFTGSLNKIYETVVVISFCFPREKEEGWIHFGSAVFFPGDGSVTTPLVETNSKLYIVLVEQMKVKPGKDPHIIIEPEHGMFVIDTSTTFSFIKHEYLEILKQYVKKNTPFTTVLEPPEPYDLCFDIITNPKNPAMPSITLYFVGGAVVKLRPDNIFVRTSHTMMCFSILSNTLIGSPYNILGGDALKGRIIVIGEETLTFGSLLEKC